MSDSRMPIGRRERAKQDKRERIRAGRAANSSHNTASAGSQRSTAGRDPLDRVEVGPPVRGEGRLVDRGIRVPASGRGARVQSLAETAQSPRTDSALAQWWAVKWIASPSDFTSTVVLLVNAGTSHVLSAVRP